MSVQQRLDTFIARVLGSSAVSDAAAATGRSDARRLLETHANEARVGTMEAGGCHAANYRSMSEKAASRLTGFLEAFRSASAAGSITVPVSAEAIKCAQSARTASIRLFRGRTARGMSRAKGNRG